MKQDSREREREREQAWGGALQPCLAGIYSWTSCWRWSEQWRCQDSCFRKNCDMMPDMQHRDRRERSEGLLSSPWGHVSYIRCLLWWDRQEPLSWPSTGYIQDKVRTVYSIVYFSSLIVPRASASRVFHDSCWVKRIFLTSLFQLYPCLYGVCYVD